MITNHNSQRKASNLKTFLLDNFWISILKLVATNCLFHSNHMNISQPIAMMRTISSLYRRLIEINLDNNIKASIKRNKHRILNNKRTPIPAMPQVPPTVNQIHHQLSPIYSWNKIKKFMLHWMDLYWGHQSINNRNLIKVQINHQIVILKISKRRNQFDRKIRLLLPFNKRK